MQIINFNSETKQLSEKTAIALGMFDGVHLGHRKVIETAIAYAKENNIKSAVITLANHPRELTQGKAPSLITNLDSRLAIFEELGIDYALVLEFNLELMNTSAEEYLEKYLVQTLNMEFISTGYDHHFGKNRSGTPELLKNWCEKNNYKLEVIPAFELDNETISSSKIRELIHGGDVETANRMLGYEFMVISTVVHGDHRGQELGFPTANLEMPKGMVIPAKGVYSGHCKHKDINYRCVVNIGTRPSFDDSNKTYIETHILDFNEDIYGEKLAVSFAKRLRDERKFESADDLVKQIEKDIANA